MGTSSMAPEQQHSPASSQSSLSRSPSPSGRPQHGFAPRLPPRAGTVHLTPYSQPPPPYSDAAQDHHSQPLTHSWSSQDPRSSSTQSLVPADSPRAGRRTLLLVYIHGFMGNESSFRSFPAHVHNLVTITLADTHVVHTKIYPRYKSRRAIEYARDDFSNWLCPHESPNTDVILLGHSMGGILSAEVALLVPYSPTSREPFRHRILGTINFDTPFLGMHPGVVVSGIGSLFRPAPDPPGTQPVLVDGVNTPLRQTTTPTTSSSVNTRGIPSSAGPQGSYFDSTSTMPALTSTASGSIDADSVLSPFASPPSDPNYNPPFPNDVRIPIRTGWDNALHFMIKHSDGLTKATKSYVTSHLEFGGCLADYKGLRNRYARIRNLEDVDEFSQDQYQGGKQKRRVRFVNYYTASTGRIKVLKAPETEHLVRRGRSPRPVEMEMHDMSLSAHTALSTSRTRSPSRSPRISVEEHRDGKIVPQPLQDLDESLQTSQYGLLDRDVASSETSGEMDTIDPSPVDDSEPSNIQGDKKHSTPSMPENPPPDPPNNLPNRSPTDTSQPSPPPPTQTSSLPPIPPLPTSPPPFDPTGYKDKDTFKLAEKEHARTLKTYQRALKDRDTAIKDRRKLLEKREKKARQDREKQLKADEKQRLKDEKEDSKRRATLNPEPKPPPISKSEKADRAVLSKPPPTEKKKKDKKFCVLPPKIDGKRDACWVRVYMEGVDEVGAHCGLFFVGAQYETLVGDVGARIEDWVRDAESVRVVEELEGERKGG